MVFFMPVSKFQYDMKSIIIDDEEIAAKGLESYCRQIPFIQIDKLFTSSKEAESYLKQSETDLIFLDIEMPGLSGLKLLKNLAKPPLVIITTAYPAYAVDGFELDVIDYLVKPFPFNRFLKACNKANEYFLMKNASNGNVVKDYFFIKVGYKIEKIVTDDVLFVQALENYVSLCTTTGKYLTLISLKNIEQILPLSNFIRVHKSFIVAKDKIEAIHGNYILIGNFKIPISRNKKGEMLKVLLANRLAKRY